MNSQPHKQDRYRPDLGPIPNRLRSLPIQNGYPVPWFVAEVEPGIFDFRYAEGKKVILAIEKELCWICGQKLGTFKAFPVGPLCTINRITAEPPSHRECAEWAIKTCPFLTQTLEQRRLENLPKSTNKAPGIANDRQPGAICLWVTTEYTIHKISPSPIDGIEGGLLFSLGKPTTISWFKKGRLATKEEVYESINTGLPILLNLAKRDGPKAVKQLKKQIQIAKELLPK